MIETEEAVRRFVEGEEEAFGPIVRRWEKKIYNLAWRMVGNREDAQDIVQETFLSVFKSIKSLRDPGSFSTWVYRIALNHCRARRRSSRFLLIDSVPIKPGMKDRPSTVFLPRSSGDSLEIRDIIQKAMAGLSEEHRSAIVLKEYVGLSLEELANVMDCPLSTAKVPRVSRPPGSSAQFETAGNH